MDTVKRWYAIHSFTKYTTIITYHYMRMYACYLFLFSCANRFMDIIVADESVFNKPVYVYYFIIYYYWMYLFEFSPFLSMWYLCYYYYKVRLSPYVNHVVVIYVIISIRFYYEFHCATYAGQPYLETRYQNNYILLSSIVTERKVFNMYYVISVR